MEIQVFDRLAEDGYSEDRPEQYKALYEKVWKLTSLPQGARILDMGCGLGTHALNLAQLGYEAYGFDLSVQAVKAAGQRARDRAVKIRLAVGDAEQAPFAAGSFDACVLGAVLHHFPDFQKVADEAFRVLKPGGLVYAYDPNVLHPYGFLAHNVANRCIRGKYFTENERALGPEELDRVFGAAGFADFQFSSMRMDSMKRQNFLIKAFRAAVYSASQIVMPKMRKGIMLIMICRKP